MLFCLIDTSKQDRFTPFIQTVYRSDITPRVLAVVFVPKNPTSALSKYLEEVCLLQATQFLWSWSWSVKKGTISLILAFLAMPPKFGLQVTLKLLAKKYFVQLEKNVNFLPLFYPLLNLYRHLHLLRIFWFIFVQRIIIWNFNENCSCVYKI